MKRNLVRVIGLMLVAVLVLSGCGRAENGSGNNIREDDGKFTIVTSFYPMYIFAKNIAKDIPDVTVVNMTEPQQGCLHDYQMTPADMKALETADVFVINGAGIESFMDTVKEQLKDLKVIEASKGMELLKNASDGEENPHVWVSISGAIDEVKNITKGLLENDNKNAEKYKKNSEDYIKKLEEQKNKMHSELQGIKNKNVVTFHEAFPYFAMEFGLNIVSVVEREPGTEPSAGELSDTINLIKKSNVKVLFAEPQYSADAAQTISTQTGAKVYVLDPVVTGPKDADAESYIRAMDENLKVLKNALNDLQ